MATPAKGYFAKDGGRVPGTTTILSRFKDSGGLIHWAWELGKEGKDYREVRDSAASIGTIAHERVECFIRGTQFAGNYPEELLQASIKPYEAFLEWAGMTQLKSGETEIPMVSEEYRYGGTPDVIFVKGKRCLGDWKTSNSVYPEYLCQLAAYKHLWEECRPDEPIEGGAHLIRFDKEYGDFHHHYYTDLDDAWESFKHMRALYDLMKKLAKRVR